MTVPSIKLAALILVLSASAVAQAATYQWQDDRGVTHFTDNADSIPERYLNRVKELPTAKGSAKKSPADSPAPPTTSSATAPEESAKQENGAKQEKHARLSRELQAIRQALPAKKQELARLYRKWSVAKGRTPTEEEIKEFEKKRAKGEATFEDNPYINKNALSTPGPARQAYYKKLAEIKKDEERVRQLEKEL
ncbi:MAG: hypothetical protein A2075_06925 [Geobacteraceae bacterium GWC2_58_44]|nr:MAG: hypothetical protein A2075_06925 [Geobacteraceae bacterium GWC2_58_44]HBG04625.1 DUF4124 domain-containing protein [Geobacter sp.]